MNLGRRIRQLRLAQNLSCAELARRTGINRGTLAKIEADQHAGLKLGQSVHIAKVLGVTVETLADETITTEAIRTAQEIATAKALVARLETKLRVEVKRGP